LLIFPSWVERKLNTDQDQKRTGYLKPNENNDIPLIILCRNLAPLDHSLIFLCPVLGGYCCSLSLSLSSDESHKSSMYDIWRPIFPPQIFSLCKVTAAFDKNSISIRMCWSVATWILMPNFWGSYIY
jgi:hypothetical protein